MGVTPLTETNGAQPYRQKMKHDQEYMHEIDGVRGVALTLVVLFHLFGHGRVSGGVDVFLVLSAYFLTRKLLRYFTEPQNLKTKLRPWPWVKKHFVGVASRLIPSALIVLVFILIVTSVVTPVSQHAQIFRELLASALYYENWELIYSQLSYGAAGPEASPLQHFWSLSVQGQFFIVWPLLTLLLASLVRPTSKNFRHLFVTLTIVFTVLSFFGALYLVTIDQPVAYFNSFTRFWELGAGAMIAFIPTSFVNFRWLREVAVLLGLVMILVCGFLFDGAQLFPGVATLWPVGGALLVLFGATRGTPSGLSARLLSTKPLAHLARIAYQLYLWHWPILVLYIQVRGYESVGWAGATFVLLLSVILAAITESATSKLSALIQSTWSMRRSMATLLVPMLVFGSATGFALLNVERAKEKALLQASQLSEEHLGGLALHNTSQENTTDLDVDFVPAAEAAADDKAHIYFENCVQPMSNNPKTSEVLVCDFDNYGSNKTVVMTGSSYSLQWYPAVRQIAEQEGWHLLVIDKNGCRLSTKMDHMPTCFEWNEQVIEVIASYNPDLIFTLGTEVSYKSDVPEKMSEGFIEQLYNLAEIDAEIIGIRGTPKYPYDVPECVQTHEDFMSKCAIEKDDKILPNFIEELDVQLPSNFTHIDMTDALCGDEKCEPVVGNILVYRDGGHMTQTYAGTLAPLLAEKLRERELL